MKQTITESMKVHESWYEEAKSQTIESLPAFLNKLIGDYGHDYGTICHAVAAAAIGAAWAMNKTDQGGITGFQAGAIMWEFIRHWSHNGNELGFKLIDYDDLLYPQCEDKFKNAISEEHWVQIQAKAASEIREHYVNKRPVHPDVLNHWESIATGKLPFDFTIKE